MAAKIEDGLTISQRYHMRLKERKSLGIVREVQPRPPHRFRVRIIEAITAKGYTALSLTRSATGWDLVLDPYNIQVYGWNAEEIMEQIQGLPYSQDFVSPTISDAILSEQLPGEMCFCPRCKVTKSLEYDFGQLRGVKRTRCKDCVAEVSRLNRAKNPNAAKKQAETSLKYRRRKKRMVLEHYGGTPPMCACCGLNDWRFLTMDHINGGGNAHRRQIGEGRLPAWLIKNNYPDGFQVLCHNCNLAKFVYGECPHITDARDLAA